MSRKIVVAATCLLCFALLFSGCSSRTPVTADTFTSVLEDNGFTVTEDYDEDTEMVLIADKGAISFAFLVYATDDDAKAVFHMAESAWDSQKGSVSSHSSVNLNTYNAYKLTTDGTYYQACRVENTLLLATCSKDDKGEVEAVTKALGY